MPTNYEHLVHGPGDGSTLRAFYTPAGKIGGLIYWENWTPLARYALYSQGKQIDVAPTADSRDIILAKARNTAVEGGISVISVCRVLRKSSYPRDFELAQARASVSDEFLETGGSAISGPDGAFLAQPPWNDAGVRHADLNLNRTVEEHRMLGVTGHYVAPTS